MRQRTQTMLRYACCCTMRIHMQVLSKHKENDFLYEKSHTTQRIAIKLNCEFSSSLNIALDSSNLRFIRKLFHSITSNLRKDIFNYFFLWLFF